MSGGLTPCRQLCSVMKLTQMMTQNKGHGGLARGPTLK